MKEAPPGDLNEIERALGDTADRLITLAYTDAMIDVESIIKSNPLVVWAIESAGARTTYLIDDVEKFQELLLVGMTPEFEGNDYRGAVARYIDRIRGFFNDVRHCVNINYPRPPPPPETPEQIAARYTKFQREQDAKKQIADEEKAARDRAAAARFAMINKSKKV